MLAWIKPVASGGGAAYLCIMTHPFYAIHSHGLIRVAAATPRASVGDTGANADATIALAREALRDLLSIQNRQISVENIQKTVADYYKIKVADMYSKKRPASIARPRQIAMYLAKELTQKSLPEIGELFGGRDHTTVLHAVRKISGERQQLTELNQQLHVLEQTLKG